MGNDDDENLTDDQLLEMPTEAMPGDLSRLWAVRAAAIHNREFNELVAELTGASSSHLMIFRDQDPRVKRQREEEAQRRAAQEMHDYMERSDRLLARIDEQERVLAKRRQEIEDYALKLHDGRRVYVDGNQYRDQQGNLLEGRDRDEAGALHRERPDASTWDQKQDIDRQAEEMKRLKEKVLKERQEAESDGQGVSADELEKRSKDADQRLTGYEKELNAQVETTHADLATKPDLTSPYDAVTLDDYAGPAGGEGKTAVPDFTRAVAAVTDTESTQKPIQPSRQAAPKIQA